MSEDHPLPATTATPHAVLLIIGTEITAGRIQESHGKTLAALLSSNGVTVDAIHIVPDGDTIISSMRRYIGDVDLLITTGGLGPTSDDMTRDAIAAVSDASLKFDRRVWDDIRRKFGGMEPPTSNKRQAEMPDGFEAIENTCGTAPGLAGSIAGTSVVALPGPPGELRAMVDTFLKGYLRNRYVPDRLADIIGTTFLIPESRLEDFFQSVARPGESWLTTAEKDRILFRYSSPEKRLEIIDLLVAEFGALRVREGEVRAAEALTAALRARTLRLVCAESCTGGLIGKMITDLPGSSDVFWGGLVTYANEAKERILSVSSIPRYGAVSRQTVDQMASNALEISSADVAVSISGVAGPGGGSNEKPVGTVWIGVRLRDGEGGAWKHRFRGDRETIRLRSAISAMLFVETAVTRGSVDNDSIWSYI